MKAFAMKKLVPLLIVAFFFFPSSDIKAAEKFVLHDLGIMGYDYSSASSINNNGVVAGNVGLSAKGFSAAFKWENGQTTILPFFDNSSWGYARAYSINDKNEIAGQLDYVDWDKPKASIWLSNGEIETSYSGAAVDINNSSQALVAGWYSVYSYLLQNGNTTMILSDEDGIEHHTPSAINDRGQVVGSATIDDYGSDYSFAYLWENEQLFDLNDLVLNEFNGHLSYADDINNLGQIIANGFLYDIGFVTELGFRATAINDNGQIVGRNFIYENGQLFDLYDLIEPNMDYIDLRVEDINNLGQIVGSATIDGSTHAVLLNPVNSTCSGDLDFDGDVDGSDLAELANSPAIMVLRDFVLDFGKAKCD